MSAQHLCVVRGSLFKYVEKSGKYDELGEVGCTIVGTVEHNQAAFKLGCYNEQNEYVCTCSIGASNDAGASVALQGNYVSFKDEENTTWSLQLDSDDDAITFCGSVAVAMYGAAGQPPDSMLVCDVTKGTSGKIALAGSLAKVRFFSWVLESNPKTHVPVLGSLIDSSEQKFLTVTVPANHLCVSDDMKGFEGMMVGMREEGCRFIVVPKATHRGSAPKVNRCFFVEVVKVKMPDQADGVASVTKNSLATSTISRSSPQKSDLALALQRSAATETVPTRSIVERSAGFNRDQFILVDRLRDQVFTLTEQLREGRKQLQTFGANVRSYEQQRKPKSLLNAQIEHSVHKLLSDVDEQKDRLALRDETLARMEEKNAQLQRSLEKYQQTSSLLQEERKSKVTAQDEEKLELDRQLLQAQTHLGRLSTEVEDTVRNVNAVKRLLDQTGSDIKKEKNELQVALVSFQTNESKLSTVKESLHEETERCSLLESKVGLLGAELKTLQDDIQAKNRAIEECRRKTESDVLHYEQLLESERQKAAEELRGVRQELMAELAARSRRYQEECQRAAQEAYDRGRAQGQDDGMAEASLAADMKAHELTLAAQRNNAESKAMESRIRAAKEEKAVDERRLSAEKEAAEERLAEEQRQIEALERKIDSLTQKRDDVTEKTFEAVRRAIEAAKGKPISQRMLLRIVGAAQAGETDVDFSLQAREDLEDNRRHTQEKDEVEAWVRATVYNQPIAMPPLRPSCAAVDGSAAEDVDAERTSVDSNDDLFVKLDDTLRIREKIRPGVDVSALPVPAAAPIAQGQLPVQDAISAQRSAVTLQQHRSPPPPPPQPHAPPQHSLPLAQPLFVARNPFQQQPNQPPLPPQPQATFTDPFRSLPSPQGSSMQLPHEAPSTTHQSNVAAPQPPLQPAPDQSQVTSLPPLTHPFANLSPPPSLQG